ncbi:voltage-gated potassium channel [Pseudomonas duriflava]|uniref:Voltage-gated potassium channel n=1 Tax=Pseudomonas duriflava TaxID=459528 RepID=A0A562PPP2_9PSED|nr:ion transporter [Pseudomonas duriflava]TWI46338.1 voltage-gated potassium channel [Pseudomonas duriflava]
MIHAKRLRRRIEIIIFRADTAAGRWFDEALLFAILASLVVVMLDSVEMFREQYRQELSILEWTFTILFGIEYLLRLYSSRRPLKYAFSFFGIVDLLAILPSLIALFLPSAQYLLIIRVLRLLRVFRILKLRQYLKQANFLITALRSSRQKITVFLLSVLTLVTLFGSLMYVVEGPANGFTSIPKSIYWAIVTLTTVGFGDITPKTPFGQGIASLVMIFGYSIIAVPTGIFTAELSNALRIDSAVHKSCTTCGKETHEVEAAFCSRCGNTLYRQADPAQS